MLRNKLTEHIKANKGLYSLLRHVKHQTNKVLPLNLIYGQDYFAVKRLLKLNDDKNSQDCVRLVLRTRLCFILKEALLNVPFYQRNVKVKAGDVNESNAFDILQSFPFLEKAAVMNDPELFLNSRYEKGQLHYVTSGGSTGQGIGMWRTRQGDDIEAAFFDHEWGKLGYVPQKSRVVRFGTEARKKDGEEPWEVFGNKLSISPYHLNQKWIERIYSKIVEFRPDFFHTYPSCLEEVAKFIVKNKLPVFKCRGLLLASEVFTEHQLDIFNKCFDAGISVNYGLTERTNIAFGEETGDGYIYRLNSVYGLSENKVDDYGNHEIVGTSYWNVAMPLIRYRTNDFGEIKDGVIKRLDGRNQEFLITKTGERIPGFTIKIDEFTWDYVDTYQVVQDQPGEIVLRIVPRKPLSDDTKDLLLSKQTQRWGDFFSIKIEVVDHIPRTRAGKFRHIVNNIGVQVSHNAR